MGEILDKIIIKGPSFIPHFFEDFKLYNDQGEVFDVKFTGLYKIDEKGNILLYYKDNYGDISHVQISDTDCYYFYPLKVPDTFGQEKCNTGLAFLTNAYRVYMVKHLNSVEEGLSQRFIKLVNEDIDFVLEKRISKITNSDIIPPKNYEEVFASLNFLSDVKRYDNLYDFFSRLTLDVIKKYSLTFIGAEWNNKKGLKLAYADEAGLAYFVYATDYQAHFYYLNFETADRKPKYDKIDISKDWREQFAELLELNYDSSRYEKIYENAVNLQKDEIISRMKNSAQSNKNLLTGV